MPAVRARSPPHAPGSIPRESIPYASITCIDGALKALRVASKRVNAVSSSHELELGILVRLHYKNKNQHRGALFWRRVEEVKRLALRLQELALPALLDQTRLAFHASDAVQQKCAAIVLPCSAAVSYATCSSTKKLKGAWTHSPDPNYLAFVLERVQSACALIDAVRRPASPMSHANGFAVADALQNRV